MPAVDVQDCQLVKKGHVRLIIIGPPNCRKTSSIVTMPEPMVVSGCPGEKNIAILTSTPTRRVRVWEPINGSKDVGWNTMRTEYLNETADVLNGKFMPGQKTVVFDGAHKTFDMFRECASAKHNGDGRKFWSETATDFQKWFASGYYSDVPLVVWTMWSAVERTDETSNETANDKIQKSIWPGLQGQSQRHIMGEVSIIYQYVEGGKAYWQLKDDEKVKGIGLRVPPEQAAGLPYKVEASWPKLAEVLSKFSVVGASMGLTSAEQGVK